MQVTRDNRDASPGNEHADAMAERIHLASAAAGAFRKENVAAGFRNEALAKGIYRMVAAVLSPHRQRVQHPRREGGDGWGFEEGIAGGEREDAVSQPKGQSRRQDHYVQVAGMIGDQNKRGSQRKVLSPDDLDAFSEPQDAPDPPPPEVAANEANETAFAFDRAHPIGFTDAKVLGRFIFPIVHKVFLLQAGGAFSDW